MTGKTRANSDNDLAELSIATAGGLAFALIAMFLLVAPLAGKAASTRDYVVFWATGQQLAHHANPYDTAAMGRIERNAGLPAGYGILYMRNPPWALPLALPLGLVNLRVGALLWSLELLGCLLVSGRLIWEMHGRRQNRIHWLMLSFAPSLCCLMVGQTALFALLGLVLFQRLQGTRPFLAGMALWLCALKPHLLLPFGAVLLLWIAVTKSYRVLAGAVTALAASSAVAALLYPAAWSGYSAMMHAPVIEEEFIPCLSVVLREWFFPRSLWVQYLPAAVACAWALAYYWRRRHTWNWMSDGSLLALVSLVAAPYCWLYDQALALPALLDAAYRTRVRSLLTVLAGLSVLVVAAMIYGFKIISGVYVLTAPVWLAWYLAACATAGASKAGIGAEEAEAGKRVADELPGAAAVRGSH
jgi:hypothetical protein